MKPLADWPLEQRRDMRGVLTDIDDTLTTGGALTPEVLAALAALRDAGLRVIAVTGRPTYWALPLLRLCRFDAIVAENGASAFWLDQHGSLQSWFYANADIRAQQRQALLAFVPLLQRRFPHVPVADDMPQRVGDLAFDIGENVRALAPAQVDEVLDFIRDHGFFATASSIHAHASLAPFSKQIATGRLLSEVFGIDDRNACAHYAFVGDSGNDAAMFAHYPQSIGVANVTHHLAQLAALPAYVTMQSFGAGFVEVAHVILDAHTNCRAASQDSTAGIERL
jgi:hydroxymethylpyrimidine pyrophosphatase-like HAD family hydrolase